jgi:hypothetical protein
MDFFIAQESGIKIRKKHTAKAVQQDVVELEGSRLASKTRTKDERLKIKS